MHALHEGGILEPAQEFLILPFFVCEPFSSHQSLGFNNLLTFPKRLFSSLFHKLQLCVCGSGRVTVKRSPIQPAVTTATAFSCTARTREKLDSYIDFPPPAALALLPPALGPAEPTGGGRGGKLVAL